MAQRSTSWTDADDGQAATGAGRDVRELLVEFEQVPAADLPRLLGALLERVRDEEERIVLTQDGEPVAVLVPPEDAALLVEIEDQLDAEIVRERASDSPIEDTITLDELVEELHL